MIDKLGFLLALARERHFGRAAEACGVTQPTLSAGLKSLEDQLGVRLVNRGSRFLGLTAEGDRVVAWAKRIVGDTRAMREDLRAHRLGLDGDLRLGVIPTALPRTPMLTAAFRDHHPGVRFTITSHSSHDILAMLENLELEAGLTYLENEALGHVLAVPLYRERYRLMTAADLPLGDRARVRWDELSDLKLCLLTPDMQNRRILDRLLARAGRSQGAVLESNSMVALLAHVRSGGWASILPEALAELVGFPETIRSIPIVEPEATQTIGLVVADLDPLTPLCAALIEEANRLRAVEETPHR